MPNAPRTWKKEREDLIAKAKKVAKLSGGGGGGDGGKMIRFSAFRWNINTTAATAAA